MHDTLYLSNLTRWRAGDLQIIEGNPPVTKSTICGSELPVDITLEQMPVTLQFFSDETVTSRGYNLEYSTKPANNTGKCKEGVTYSATLLTEWIRVFFCKAERITDRHPKVLDMQV